jgi:glycosyltransferase involved in cell wall biosynthesis
MTKIIHVVTLMNRGGLENMIMNHFRLLENDFKFIFLVQKRGKQDFFDEINALGGKIVYAYREKIIDYFLFPIRVNKIIRKEKPDIVHSHIDTLSAIPLLIAKLNKVPIRIAHSHNSEQEKNLIYPVKLILKSFIPIFSTQLIACSSSAGSWMFGKNRFDILPNGIMVDSFLFNKDYRYEIQKKHEMEQSFVIGHVGRFFVQKNHEFILSVFSKVLTYIPNSILLLIGGGPLKEDTRNKVKSMGLEGNVRFVESSDQISKFYSAMDIFILPSYFEGMPLVLLEAQAAGLDCIVSNRISDESIILKTTLRLPIEQESIQLWAEKLTKKLRNRFLTSEELNLMKSRVDSKFLYKDLIKYYISNI